MLNLSLDLRTSNRRPSRPSRESRSSRLTRTTPRVGGGSARIMRAVSFTFKYLPNIIQQVCTHVAVRDTFALTAWASQVCNLLAAIITRASDASCVSGRAGCGKLCVHNSHARQAGRGEGGYSPCLAHPAPFARRALGTLADFFSILLEVQGVRSRPKAGVLMMPVLSSSSYGTRIR